MGKVKDLTGMRFEKLVVESFYGFKTKPNGERSALWLCRCDCGNEKIINRNELTSGRTKSCGCLRPRKNMKKQRKELPHNTYDLSGEYGIGYDSKGNKFYFDLEDYDKIKNHYWALREDEYISTTIKKS